MYLSWYNNNRNHKSYMFGVEFLVNFLICRANIIGLLWTMKSPGTAVHICPSLSLDVLIKFHILVTSTFNRESKRIVWLFQIYICWIYDFFSEAPLCFVQISSSAFSDEVRFFFSMRIISLMLRRWVDFEKREFSVFTCAPSGGVN